MPCAEEADVERSDETADEVDADDVERVVEAELELEVDREGADGTGDDAEHDGPERRQDVTGRGDGDETGDGTGCGTDRGGLAVLDLLDDEPAEDGGGGSGEGVDEGDGGDAVGGSSEPALKPNQPNQRSAAPSSTSGRLCGLSMPLAKPTRLPSTRARARPAAPALMCTAVPPAKSITPTTRPDAPAEPMPSSRG